MSNALVTILVSMIGLITAAITGFFAFAGKNRENKASVQDQFADDLMADRAFWREESAAIRTRFESLVLENAQLKAELAATKEALVHQTRQAIAVVKDE